MTESQYRYNIAIIILVANIFIFLLIIALNAFGGFSHQDLLEIFRFLLPIKTAYMTLLVKYIIANKHEKPEQNDSFILNRLYTSVTTIIIICNITFLSLSIILFAFNTMIENIDSLKTYIAVIETLFGAYVGIIISDIFKIEKNNSQE